MLPGGSGKGTTTHPVSALARLGAALARLLPLALAPVALAPFALAGPPPTGGASAGGGHAALRSFTLQPGSAVTFRASDAFGGFSGEAPIASLSLEADPRRLADTLGSVTVKSKAVTTGNFLRDVNAARTVFEASEYPTIRFRVNAVDVRSGSLVDGAAVEVAVHGHLRMHGVEREVVARGRVTRSGDELEAMLSMQLRLSDFDMKRPRFFTVVVGDVIQVHVHLILGMQSRPAG